MGIETTLVLAQNGDAATAGAGGGVGGLLGYLVGALILSFTFVKAGEPRWAAFVPFYNAYTLVKIAGYNPLMFLLLIVPIVNVVFALFLALRLAQGFGKSSVFGVFGLWLFSLIGYLILGFGSATYDRGRIQGAVPA